MQQARGASSAYLVLLAGSVWAAFIAGLLVFPMLYPPDPGLPNAAAALGYNIPAAYLTFLGIAGFAGLWIAYLGPTLASMAPPSPDPEESPAWLLWVERIGLLSIIPLVFWPPAMARFGPHIEADYAIHALWRIACGQAPYTDFEFLYGPLLIGLAQAWTALSGFSMLSYYSFYMLLQVLMFGAVLLVLQAHIRTPWQRYLALLLLLPFLFDTLAGLNTMPWRYFLVPLMILAIAARPASLAQGLMAGGMIGVQAALSYEYGIAALLVALALYGVQLFYPDRRNALAAGAVAVVGGIAIWAGLAWLSTGTGFADYLASTVEVSVRSSELGLAQFAFHWTGHSLALFLVMCCGMVLFSGSLRYLGRKPLAAGDLHLIGAMVFAVIVFRFTLQRADYSHMIIPFVPLFLAVLLNQPRSLLGSSTVLRQIMLAGIVVAAVAHGAGHSFLGKGMLQIQARGILQELREAPTVGAYPSRRPGIQSERSHSSPDLIELAALLATPALAQRSVLFYGSAWDWPAHVGVCPTGYSFYDRLYASRLHPHLRSVEENPSLLVVIPSDVYQQLKAGETPKAELQQFKDIRKSLGWLTSPHYSQEEFEKRAEFEQWRESLGSTLVERFRPLTGTGSYTVLERPP